MKITIRDMLEAEWTYDTKQQRFYVAAADEELLANGTEPITKDGIVHNGYILDPFTELFDFMVRKPDGSYDFDPLFVVPFVQRCQIGVYNRMTK